MNINSIFPNRWILMVQSILGFRSVKVIVDCIKQITPLKRSGKCEVTNGKTFSTLLQWGTKLGNNPIYCSFLTSQITSQILSLKIFDEFIELFTASFCFVNLFVKSDTGIGDGWTCTIDNASNACRWNG